MLPSAIPCAACADRPPVTTLRDAFVPGLVFDATLGLRDVDGTTFECPTCGTRYRRQVERATHFQDADEYFFTKLPPPAATTGCARCHGTDAELAWRAGRTRHLQSLIDESHYDIAITACDCGQQFVKVFTERIDWVNGEDDQTSMLLPLQPAEADELRRCPIGELRERLHALPQRRFVLHWYPSGGALQTAWRDGGFWIGPHD